MSILGFLLLLVVAAIVGSIGQSIAGFSRGGCLFSILVGFVGAYIGMWLAQQLHLPEIFVLNIEGQPFPLLWAIIGSAIFSGILALIFRRPWVRDYRYR